MRAHVFGRMRVHTVQKLHLVLALSTFVKTLHMDKHSRARARVFLFRKARTRIRMSPFFLDTYRKRYTKPVSASTCTHTSQWPNNLRRYDNHTYIHTRTHTHAHVCLFSKAHA